MKVTSHGFNYWRRPKTELVYDVIEVSAVVCFGRLEEASCDYWQVGAWASLLDATEASIVAVALQSSEKAQIGA